MGIKLLTMKDKESPNAFTISKSYRKYKEDQIIIVSPSPSNHLIHTLQHVVGPTSNLDHWETILAMRIDIPNPKKYIPLKLTPYGKLCESPTYKSDPLRKFLLCDSVGTVDREDGIWYDSPKKYGIFTIDIPHQFGWTNSSQGALNTLCTQWDELTKSGVYGKHMPTQSLYLPNMRLSMLEKDTYNCVSKETLDTHGKINIICYDIPNHSIFLASIQSHQDVTYINDLVDAPEWFKKSPLNGTSVADWNIAMNTQWLPIMTKMYQHTVDYKLYGLCRSHPNFEKDIYVPITSPVRSICDLWNQCLLHDIISHNKIKKLFVYSNFVEINKMYVKDSVRSKHIKCHASSLQLAKTVMTSDGDSEFDAFVTYISTKGYGFAELILKCDPLQRPTVWISEETLKDATVGDCIRIKCSITRNPDPYQKIRVASIEKES